MTSLFTKTTPGEGALNFVLIHNAGGNHHFFDPQVAVLQQYGNVVQLDLPGHGKSQPLAQYMMQDLAQSVAQVCRDLALTNISVVGLNNGANIAIEMALTQALPVQNLILIDPPLGMDKSFVEEIQGFIGQLDSPDYPAFCQKLVEALFIHTTATHKAIALDAFKTVNREALKEIFRGLIEWNKNSSERIKNLSCPTLCILTDEHHCSYQALQGYAPLIEVGKVIGSKCWATLEVPAQVNAMISRFLEINPLRPV